MLENRGRCYSGCFGVGASSPVPPTACLMLRVLSSRLRARLPACMAARARANLLTLLGSMPLTSSIATSSDTYLGLPLAGLRPATGARAAFHPRARNHASHVRLSTPSMRATCVSLMSERSMCGVYSRWRDYAAIATRLIQPPQPRHLCHVANRGTHHINRSVSPRIALRRIGWL